MIGDTYLESISYKAETKLMYYFSINLMTKKFGGESLKYLRWEGYRLEWLTKWKWYFDYRAALLKVENPKYDVVCNWGKFETEVKEDQKVVTIRKLKKDIVTAKRMKTKYFNAIEKYKLEQEKVLIPDWENIAYKKALDKLDFYTSKLKELQDKINELGEN